MGKGDIKSKKGKITNKTFGKKRPHRSPASKKAKVIEPTASTQETV